MPDGWNAALSALESLTAEIAEAPGLSLESLVDMVRLRSRLIEQVMALPLDETAFTRLQAVLRAGAEAEGRLVAIREALRQELAGIGQHQSLIRELSRAVPQTHSHVKINL